MQTEIHGVEHPGAVEGNDGDAVGEDGALHELLHLSGGGGFGEGAKEWLKWSGAGAKPTPAQSGADGFIVGVFW